MIKRFALAFLLLSILTTARAQFDTVYMKQNIRQCADSMMFGFKTRNWDMFTRYSYPALVGSMGGKKEYAEYIASMFNGIPDSAWKKYETGNILQVVKAGRDFQTIVELNSIIEFEGTRVTSLSYLIGESWDGGRFWTFFDSQGDAVASKQLNANLSPELIIPQTIEKKEPVSQQGNKVPFKN